NASDQLVGGGHDVLALSGPGTFDLRSLAQFSGFSDVILNNSSSPGSQVLYLPNGQALAVDASGSSSDEIHLGSGTSTVTLGSNSTVYLGSGNATINEAGPSSVDTYYLSSGNYVINDSSNTLNVWNTNVAATGDLTINHSVSNGSNVYFYDNLSLTSGISTVSENLTANNYLVVRPVFQLSSGNAAITENLSAPYIYSYGGTYDLSSGAYDIKIS